MKKANLIICIYYYKLDSYFCTAIGITPDGP